MGGALACSSPTNVADRTSYSMTAHCIDLSVDGYMTEKMRCLVTYHKARTRFYFVCYTPRIVCRLSSRGWGGKVSQARHRVRPMASMLR